jgi:BASS family bile acid:Na+ symporter
MSSISVSPELEQAVIIVVNIFIAFAAGSATEARKFARVSKIAPILPIISQFAIQPWITYGLCTAFGLNTYFTVGMVICATTPGGNGSNIAEVIFGGDVELGIFMTFCSTIVSAGAIPLNFYLIISPLLPLVDGQEAPVPIVAIATAAAVLIGGASAGCIVRYLSDSLGRRLEYWCIKIGVALLIAGVALSIAQTQGIWYLLGWRNFVVGMLLPAWKFVLTYAGAKALRLDERIAQTASMEAGEQNIAVALAILSLAFEQSDERNQMLSGLMIYTLFNQAVATPLVTLLFWRTGRARRRQEKAAADAEAAATAAAAAAEAAAGAPARTSADEAGSEVQLEGLSSAAGSAGGGDVESAAPDGAAAHNRAVDAGAAGGGGWWAWRRWCASERAVAVTLHPPAAASPVVRADAKPAGTGLPSLWGGSRRGAEGGGGGKGGPSSSVEVRPSDAGDDALKS